MRSSERITGERYADIDYHQFTQGPGLRAAIRVAGILSWPIVLPMAAVARLSDFIFRTASEFLAVVPYVFGSIMRSEFYRFTLRKFGENVSIGFGTIFVYRDIEIGSHISIGNHCVFHYCDVGSYVLIADGCSFLSGARYHNYDRTDTPMALQGGKLRRITIGDDCWIGVNSVIMNDVGKGAIVGAGTVVTAAVKPYSVVHGNPAQVNPILTSFRRGDETP